MHFGDGKDTFKPVGMCKQKPDTTEGMLTNQKLNSFSTVNFFCFFFDLINKRNEKANPLFITP